MSILLTWLLRTKTSLPARMKSAASKQISRSVIMNLPCLASFLRSSMSVIG